MLQTMPFEAKNDDFGHVYLRNSAIWRINMRQINIIEADIPRFVHI